MYKIKIRVEISEQIEKSVTQFEAMLIEKEIYLIKINYQEVHNVVELTVSDTEYPATLSVISRAYACFMNNVLSIHKI